MTGDSRKSYTKILHLSCFGIRKYFAQAIYKLSDGSGFLGFHRKCNKLGKEFNKATSSDKNQQRSFR